MLSLRKFVAILLHPSENLINTEIGKLSSAIQLVSRFTQLHIIAIRTLGNLKAKLSGK